MKSNTVARNVTISASESAVFGISNNAKIFRILIDGLYADKIQSITREIWSNALDAHVQAGCADRPFAVSFPSPFDATFRVRDYGVSLTHDQVMHMYTSLGHSTKEDSNDVIGKFGIGSKSPFAYTDNFTVTVYLDGEVRFYSAMIGADSVPAIHLMGVAETTEENGVEVAFPVEASDARAFAAAAKRISHGFDVKPVVMGGDNFDGWPELPVLLEGDGWKLLKGAIEGYSERAYARMGPVLYPINVNALNDITADQRALLGHTFVLDFPMGDLEMTASREELSYGRNDPTAASISKRIDEVLEVLKEKALASYDECETYLDACCKYREEITSPQLPGVIKSMIMKDAKWRGRGLDTTLSIPSMRGVSMAVIVKEKIKNKTYRFTTTPKNSVTASKRILVAYEDLSEGEEIKRSPARLREFANNNRSKYDTIIWVKVFSVRNCVSPLMQFFIDFDGIDVIAIADMELPASNRTSGGNYVRRPVMARYIDSSGNFNQIALDDEDFEDGGIYVPMERMNAQNSPSGHSPVHVYNLLRSLGAINENVYGAPKSMQKKFEGDQWVNLYDFARNWFDEQEVDIAAARARRSAVSEVRNDPLLEFVETYVGKDDVSQGDTIWDALELLSKAKADNTPDPRHMHALADSLRITIPPAEDDFADALEEDLVKVRAALIAQYPLIEILMSSNVRYSDKSVDLVTEYVNMCDNVSETNHQAAIAA
ncbi:rIIA lysis inhibitor [Ruegeria phage vB_RpoS-V10]|nr:rIIA lysis inhibitor [Ruegeria phage vB_RpoS-V10]